MSRIKAKKKRKTPLDPKQKKYSFEDVVKLSRELADEVANAKAIELFRKYSTQNASETGVAVLQLCCITLNDKWGFGKKRLEAFHDEVWTRLQDFQKGLYELEDIEEVYSGLLNKYKLDVKDERSDK